MNKNFQSLIPALALSLMLSGCSADEIFVTDEAFSSGGSSATLIDPALSWSESAFEATIGASNAFPSLTNIYGLSVSYSSSDTAVATIDGEGNILILSAGTTAIMATSTATDTYSSGSASYALTVLKGTDGIAWSAASCTVNIDEGSHTFPTLSNPGNQSVAYSSSNESVATIDSAGSITLFAEGSTTITATSEANDAYEASSVSYDLTVEGNLKAAGLSWSESSYTATLAYDGNEYPTLSNPNGLTVSYASSDASVATVDASGTITLVGAGTTSIIASSEANDTYASGSASYTLKVVKNTVTLAWSASSFSVVLEDGATDYPTLSIDPADAGITVSYSSTNTAVATVDATGNITLKGTGSSTISASFEGNTYYKAAADSYLLTVKSSADDGAVTTVFASSGDSSSDDDISNTTFTRLVTVTYGSAGATVTGCSAVADVMDVSVNGNQVAITYTGSENVAYKLSGTASNGFFKLYSSKKQALWLSGLSLTNPSGAAINNQSGKRTFVYVDGTNTLADGSSAAYSTSGDEDMKGVFFSEGQLIFSGSGSLKVTANNSVSKSGIVSDDYVRMMDGPMVTVSAGSKAGHGVKANEYVQLSGGTLSITTSAAMKKGITSDDYVLVEGGLTTIKVTGGTAYDSDDAEYKGSAGIKADNYFGMTGGTVTITNSGSGGKGVHAGSYDYDATSHKVADSYISGGTLTITTTGSESNDVSSKGMKIGWVTKSGSGDRATVTGYAGNLKISGGKVIVSVSKSEGIEAKGNIVISGGETYVSSTGDDAINSQAELDVTGGYVYAFSSANDAMDANHDMKLSGGYVFAVTTKGSPEVALDANTEQNYKLYIQSGATVVAYGGLESGYSASQSVYSMSCSAGSWNALHNGSSYIAAFKAPSGVSSVTVSAPSLNKGYTGVSVGSTTYCSGIWAISGISGGSSVSLSTYSGGGGSPGGGGGGRPGGH
jgi:hypothetical protein